MSYKKYNDERIKNEDTLVRRAWVDSAIEGARSHKDVIPPAEAGGLFYSETVEFRAAAGEEAEETGPHLVLAWDADQRRSGT